MKEKKIYLVSSGSYSDYGIDAVFTTKKLAERYISAQTRDYDEYQVEEYDLDRNVKQMKPGYRFFVVNMSYDGTVNNCEPYYDSDYNHPLVDYANCLRNSCYARDSKHAIKITNEIRAQMIANNLFKPNK